ncbi:hypothetical protein BLNAU_378 [Blattamonas nauphoetae]|uniref:Uncharacterized protein n=1 Tax=Blattamonas nauphoetae TaxID=2049346 RepID=A0ABQ9YL42_9EUKA|nr:hypothetical protein BLNAU_378 [Blattamonas nauphoetae]
MFVTPTITLGPGQENIYEPVVNPEAYLSYTDLLKIKVISIPVRACPYYTATLFPPLINFGECKQDTTCASFRLEYHFESLYNIEYPFVIDTWELNSTVTLSCTNGSIPSQNGMTITVTLRLPKASNAPLPASLGRFVMKGGGIKPRTTTVEFVSEEKLELPPSSQILMYGGPKSLRSLSNRLSSTNRVHSQTDSRSTQSSSFSFSLSLSSMHSTDTDEGLLSSLSTLRKVSTHSSKHLSSSGQKVVLSTDSSKSGHRHRSHRHDRSIRRKSGHSHGKSRHSSETSLETESLSLSSFVTSLSHLTGTTDDSNYTSLTSTFDSEGISLSSSLKSTGLATSSFANPFTSSENLSSLSRTGTDQTNGISSLHSPSTHLPTDSSATVSTTDLTDSRQISSFLLSSSAQPSLPTDSIPSSMRDSSTTAALSDLRNSLTSSTHPFTSTLTSTSHHPGGTTQSRATSSLQTSSTDITTLSATPHTSVPPSTTTLSTTSTPSDTLPTHSETLTHLSNTSTTPAPTRPTRSTGRTGPLYTTTTPGSPAQIVSGSTSHSSLLASSGSFATITRTSAALSSLQPSVHGSMSDFSLPKKVIKFPVDNPELALRQVEAQTIYTDVKPRVVGPTLNVAAGGKGSTVPLAQLIADSFGGGNRVKEGFTDSTSSYYTITASSVSLPTRYSITTYSDTNTSSLTASTENTTNTNGSRVPRKLYNPKVPPVRLSLTQLMITNVPKNFPKLLLIKRFWKYGRIIWLDPLADFEFIWVMEYSMTIEAIRAAGGEAGKPIGKKKLECYLGVDQME